MLHEERELMKRLRASPPTLTSGWRSSDRAPNQELWSLGGQRLPIPRHREINERTARGIITTAQEVTCNGS